MKLTPYPAPHGWRLVLFCAFLFSIYTQLNAQNQAIAIDSVENFDLSTRLFQWSFDRDSISEAHGEFYQISDTTGGNDGPLLGSGFDASTGFSFSAYSTDPRARLRFGPFDTRGMEDVTFQFHLAAPSGVFENDDFIGVNISLDGGQSFYNQIKVKGSRSGTSASGWQHQDGIHYRKNFRYSSRSSVIYGHVDPISKDTIAGISALSIDQIPPTEALYILVELTNSTNDQEIYNVDNFTLSANLPTATSTLDKDKAYRVVNGGSYLAVSDSIHSLYIEVEEQDTVTLLGNPVITGPIYIRGGWLQGNLTLATAMGGVLHGDQFIGQQFYERVISDSGYHFIGQPAYFESVDSMDYVWIYDAKVGDWKHPSAAKHFPDSGVSMARVIYVPPTDLPVLLRGVLTSTTNSQTVALLWADTCLDGETPFGGWNLVANTAGRALNWNALVPSEGFPDSTDATVYLWRQGGYGSYNVHTGSVGGSPIIGLDEAFWVRLSHAQDPGTVRLDLAAPKGSQKRSGRIKTAMHTAVSSTDTVDFYFQSQSNRGVAIGSFHARLLIDPAFTKAFMPCCDQLFLGGPLQPQLVLRKSKTSMTIANYPKSSYYPIMVVGEGALTSKGAPGYFYLPPNIYPGTSTVNLQGAGPHKVYWLGADHPDVHSDDVELADVLDIPEHPTVTDSQGNQKAWDILGRPGGSQANFELQFIDGAWKKVVRVK